MRVLLKKLFRMEQKWVKDDTKTEKVSVEDPISMHKTGSNDKILIFEIANIINEKNCYYCNRQEKKISFNFKRWILCWATISLSFQDIPLSHARYIKGWWTLIGTLHLIKIFLSVYEEQHLPSSINFVLHKIKLGTLASEHFRYLTEVTMYFHLWAQAKEQQRTGNSFVWCNSYD